MMMRNHVSIAALCALVLLCAPMASHAGISGLLSRAAAWWSAKSVGISSSEVKPTSDNPSGAEAEDGGDGSPGEQPATGVPGMCRVPREPPRMVCEIGSGFLCVDTPAGGVAAGSFVLRGTIDRMNSVLASIRIAAQSEYTKKTSLVDTSSPAEGDCGNGPPDGGGFCLDAEGRFSAAVPLPSQGPYTILVSASRLSGESVEKRVRTSRVVALSFDEKGLVFDPDVRTKNTVDATHVLATVSLLSDCQFCDFIGAATNGVKITVENAVRDPRGSTRRISCSTTVEQGGQGRFVVGVPTGAGTNALTVRACNAAFPEDKCPAVGGISFEGKGDESALEISSPPPQPSYDSNEYPTIRWDFSLGGGKECSQLQFNREPPQEICPDESGRFSVELAPRAGINVASLARGEGTEEFAWTFGWGRIASPFGKQDGIIDVPHAARLSIPARTFEKIVLPLANNFLASDEFGQFVKQLLANLDWRAEKEKDGEPRVEIPKCGGGGGPEGFVYSLRGDPAIDGARIGELKFGEGRIDIEAVLDGVRLGLGLAADKDGDGKADKDPLPLVIAFRKAVIDVTLALSKDGEGRQLILLTSPHDDCSFKNGSYCKHTPAPLIPQNFVGGVNSWGGFIRCDVDAAGSEAKDACRAINTINAQTGIVAEKVLDAINAAIYCGGSAVLTSLTREGIRFPDIRTGCQEKEECGGALARILPSIRLPIAIRLEDDVEITNSGISVPVAAIVGDSDLYDRTPDEFHIPSAGMIAGDGFGAKPLSLGSASGADLSAALSLYAVDALLFAAAAQGDGRKERGLFDFDIDEGFFNGLGFDFVKECDAFVAVPGEKEKPPTLCFIRPGVGWLLGSALTTYGYFPASQPLLVAIRGNRVLGSRITVRALDDLPVVARAESAGGGGEGSEYVPTGSLLEVELGGVVFSFYALEVDEGQPPDEYGNLPVKKDRNGSPIIRSLQPGDPDPQNGPIISFDLTLLLAVEVGAIESDPEDGSKSSMSLRVLSDRSRLVIVPIEGTNATMVPSVGLVSQLSEMLKLAIAGMSSSDKPIRIPIPKEIALGGADSDDIFGLLGLRKISFGPNGLSLEFDPDQNAAILAIQAAITQVLHEGEKEVERIVP